MPRFIFHSSTALEDGCITRRRNPAGVRSDQADAGITSVHQFRVRGVRNPFLRRPQYASTHQGAPGSVRQTTTLRAPAAVSRSLRQVGIEGCWAEWQQRMTSECHDHRHLRPGDDGGPRLGRSGPHIPDCPALAPLRHGPGGDAELSTRLCKPSGPPMSRGRAGLRPLIAVVLPGERALASGPEPVAPRWLDRGAAMKNLSHRHLPFQRKDRTIKSRDQTARPAFAVCGRLPDERMPGCCVGHGRLDGNRQSVQPGPLVWLFSCVFAMGLPVLLTLEFRSTI